MKECILLNVDPFETFMESACEARDMDTLCSMYMEYEKNLSFYQEAKKESWFKKEIGDLKDYVTGSGKKEPIVIKIILGIPRFFIAIGKFLLDGYIHLIEKLVDYSMKDDPLMDEINRMKEEVEKNSETINKALNKKPVAVHNDKVINIDKDSLNYFEDVAETLASGTMNWGDTIGKLYEKCITSKSKSKSIDNDILKEIFNKDFYDLMHDGINKSVKLVNKRGSAVSVTYIFKRFKHVQGRIAMVNNNFSDKHVSEVTQNIVKKVYEGTQENSSDEQKSEANFITNVFSEFLKRCQKTFNEFKDMCRSAVTSVINQVKNDFGDGRIDNIPVIEYMI